MANIKDINFVNNGEELFEMDIKMGLDLLLEEYDRNYKKVKALFGSRLKAGSIKQSDINKLFALYIGFQSDTYDTGCEYLIKTEGIKEKLIKNSAIYNAFLDSHKKQANMAYGILESDNKKAKEYLLHKISEKNPYDLVRDVFNLYKKEHNLSDKDPILLDRVFFFDAPKPTIKSIFIGAYYLYTLRFYNIPYEGGVTEQFLHMVIEQDKKEHSMYSILNEDVLIPDSADDKLEDLFLYYFNVLCDVDSYYEFSNIVNRYDYSLGCDVMLLLFQFSAMYPEEFENAVDRSLEGVYQTIPSKMIRYDESVQAKNLVDSYVIGDVLLRLFMYHQSKLEQSNTDLQNRLDVIKAELSSLKREQSQVQKSTDEYNIRVAAAEAKFAEKEKSYQIQKQALEEENKKLQRENNLLQKENERLLQLLEKKNKQEEQDSEEISEIESTSGVSYEQMYETLAKMPAMIIGGHDNWHNQMKKYFPEWKFIKAASTTNKAEMFRNMKNIIFATDHLDHSLFHNCMNSLTDETNIYYVHKTNVKACVQELYEQYEMFQNENCIEQ